MRFKKVIGICAKQLPQMTTGKLYFLRLDGLIVQNSVYQPEVVSDLAELRSVPET